MATLYLIPNLLSDAPWQDVLPVSIPEKVTKLKHFIVEDIRNARRFLKRVRPDIQIDGLNFYELNKHTTEEQKSHLLEPVTEGFDIGLISEAGCPGVADPGAEIVMAAHQRKIKVVPLVGPSSILLALMGSGMDGQNFAFSGYLPVKQAERIRKIEQLERLAITHRQSQIFMETPYRNNQLIRDLIRTCHSTTMLCVAADITSPFEWISTQTILEWGKKIPDLDKKPVIFILGG